MTWDDESDERSAPVLDRVCSSRVLESEVFDSVLDPVFVSELDSVLDAVLDSELDPVLDSELDSELELTKLNPVLDSELDSELEPVELDPVLDSELDTDLKPVLDSELDSELDDEITSTNTPVDELELELLAVMLSPIKGSSTIGALKPEQSQNSCELDVVPFIAPGKHTHVSKSSMKLITDAHSRALLR